MILQISKFVNSNDCQQIWQYLKDHTSNTYKEDNTRPWLENNNLFYSSIKNEFIKNLILKYVFKTSIIISHKYKCEVYPHYTDLVVWNKGKSMEEHVDNGEGNNIEIKEKLSPRHFTSLIYLNNEFKGGQTFIKNKIIKPELGKLVVFKSNVKHGVKEIKEGIRGTIASWFTKDFKNFNL